MAECSQANIGSNRPAIHSLVAFLDSISGYAADPLTFYSIHQSTKRRHGQVLTRPCKSGLRAVVFFHHPSRGLHSVEKVPMLAFCMGAFGSPKPGFPGFGHLSGVC